MELLLAAVAVGLPLLVAVIVSTQARSAPPSPRRGTPASRRAILRRIRERLREIPKPRGRVFTSSMSGVRVRTRTVRDAGGGTNACWVLAVAAGAERRRIPRSLVLRAEPALAGVTRILARDEIVTGDDAFDRAVSVRGSTAEALAALSRPARLALRGLLQRGSLDVRDGRVEMRLRLGGDEPESDRFVARRAAALVAALALAPGEVPARLARNALSDRVPGVRLRSLEILQRTMAGDPEQVRATRGALGDADAGVRLAAARFAGDEGIAALRGLVEEESAEPAVRREALVVLELLQPAERAVEALAALRPDAIASAEVRHAFLTAVGRLRVATHRPWIESLLDDRDVPTACAAAAALGDLGDVVVEPALLRALGRVSPDVKAAAARSLARVGTVAAVEPLLRFAKDVWADPPLREAAQDAVAAIQARLDGAEAGGLTLADAPDARGALSVPDARAGGLSPAQDDVPAERAPRSSNS